jgi:hypothetical protein
MPAWIPRRRRTFGCSSVEPVAARATKRVPALGLDAAPAIRAFRDCRRQLQDARPNTRAGLSLRSAGSPATRWAPHRQADPALLSRRRQCWYSSVATARSAPAPASAQPGGAGAASCNWREVVCRVWLIAPPVRTPICLSGRSDSSQRQNSPTTFDAGRCQNPRGPRCET